MKGNASRLLRRSMGLLAVLAALAFLIPAALKDAGPGLAQQAGFTVCPDAGKWALSVWTGAAGTPMSQAAATCSPKAIDTAFAWDYGPQGWLYWIAGADAVSTLKDADNQQAMFLHGGEVGPPPTPSPTPTATPTAVPTPAPTATPTAPY